MDIVAGFDGTGAITMRGTIAVVRASAQPSHSVRGSQCRSQDHSIGAPGC